MTEPVASGLLESGVILPVMEEFYTLQGEGFNTGLAAYFIRIGGCDVGCKWCDIKESWNSRKFPPVSVDEVIVRATAHEAKAVVVTGGEPLLYNLDYLCKGLKKKHIKTFIETSGSQALSGMWDWICVSPKPGSPPLDDVINRANELKIVIFDDDDLHWAEECAALVRKGCHLFLQPEWSRRERMMPLIIDYILRNPKWRISLQSHKYMRIP